MSDEFYPYSTLLEKHPAVGDVVPERFWNHIANVRNETVGYLSGKWCRNLRKNIKKLYGKHGSIAYECHGLGVNKAVIGVGAGPSFNLNSGTLKGIVQSNAMVPIEYQAFLVGVSNHQLKPCLKRGIFPHFVLLVDASDALYDQMCVDIPKGIRPILLTPLHTSPKVLREWDRQGGDIRFYLANDDEQMEIFRKETKEEPEKISSEQGGNVLNQLWILSSKFLGSKVFMAVGNDMGYPPANSLEQRRQGFYADGDYSSNIANRRDEARKKLDWMGFKFTKSIITDDWLVDLALFSTSKQLLTYKVWIESQIIANTDKGFHYYNCSEQGILGMCAKSMEKDALSDRNNWYLLDEAVPRSWHTRQLAYAAREFMEARKWVKVTRTAVPVAERWQEKRIVSATDAGRGRDSLRLSL